MEIPCARIVDLWVVYLKWWPITGSYTCSLIHVALTMFDPTHIVHVHRVLHVCTASQWAVAGLTNKNMSLIFISIMSPALNLKNSKSRIQRIKARQQMVLYMIQCNCTCTCMRMRMDLSTVCMCAEVQIQCSCKWGKIMWSNSNVPWSRRALGTCALLKSVIPSSTVCGCILERINLHKKDKVKRRFWWKNVWPWCVLWS